MAMRLRSVVGLGARPFSTSRAFLNKIPDNTLVIKPEDAKLDKADLSGAPKELQQRIVRIFKESKPATQSGFHNTEGWRLDWDIVDRANRWEDHTIGYASSGDYMQGTQIKFHSKDAAINFAEGQGWDFYIQEPKKRKFEPKSYAENFLHCPTELKHIRTK